MRIETERLLITEFSADMAPDVYENSLDEDNRKFVPDEVFESVEDAGKALEFLISRYGKFDGPLAYPVLTKSGRENIGYVQLVPLNGGDWEIGYHIAKKHTGHGYATEAVRAFLPVVAKATGISEVYGVCLRENAASKHVLEKCGFHSVFEGIGDYQGKKREIFKSVWKVPDQGKPGKPGSLKLKKLPGDLTVCRLASAEQAILTQDFFFIGKTDEEISLVCRTEDTPAETVAREDGWRGFRIRGMLDFSLIGVLSKLSGILAGHQIGIFAVSTYNTDYILVKEENFDRAIEALASEGYTIV